MKWLTGLSVVMLFVILFFGLRPKDFFFSNGVEWITDQPGIRFGKYGLVYADPFIEPAEDSISGPDSFSVEIALKPSDYDEGGFNFIFALHNGDDDDQLVIGQWRSWIIFMNGDDYDYSRRIKRISVDTAPQPRTKRFITVTTGKEGTDVYFDGEIAGTKEDLNLKIPKGGKARLLLGNSVYGKNSWQGEIYGLALYRHTLTGRDAALHFNRWSESQNFSFAAKDNPFALYLFDEKSGESAFDHSDGNHHLEIPSRMPKLERKILSPPWRRFELNRSLIQDIIVNLVGFIPFGFVVAATIIKLGGTFERHGVLIAVALCFLVSLLIEIVQAWIPSRSSAGLDLGLNSLGATIGAAMYKFLSLKVQGSGFRVQSQR